jgi:alcohol dehydrogenase
MNPFECKLLTRIISGPGSVDRLGGIAAELGFRRTLLVADLGMESAGYVARVTKLLNDVGVDVFVFNDYGVNPDSTVIERGRSFSESLKPDSIIGLGGGSSLDCAKGINFVLTNGGNITDYIGYHITAQPLLPMIGVPTTAGTGSEVQSYAVLAEAGTHKKIACGTPTAAFRVAILDAELTVSQPQDVTATSGFDAIAHSVETFVSTRRTPFSEILSREAWRLLESNYETVLGSPNNLSAREAMQFGACLAGIAIENSMLGATHACANPLTAHYGTIHGAALAMLLPTVVRWNVTTSEERYADLSEAAGLEGTNPTEALASRLEQLAELGGLQQRLRSNGIEEVDLPILAGEASEQWTGRFNPRPFDYQGALEVYQTAY